MGFSWSMPVIMLIQEELSVSAWLWGQDHRQFLAVCCLLITDYVLTAACEDGDEDDGGRSRPRARPDDWPRSS